MRKGAAERVGRAHRRREGGRTRRERGENSGRKKGGGERRRSRRRRSRETGETFGGRPGRSSDIYPINRFESSNRGSGDRSDTYTHSAHVYICIRAPFRVPPRGRTDTRESSIRYIYLMPNVDLLCLITGADIDGSVCASKRARKPREAPRRGG